MPKICPKCGNIAEDSATFCHLDGTPLTEHPVTPHQEAAAARSMPLAPAASDREAFIGKTILEQFQILEICGSGSMGTVYKAHQLQMERTVAVKILHPELANQPEAVLRFHREAKVVSTLSHPNIVHIYLFGHLPDGNLYIIQEFVRGRSLGDDMSKGPLGMRRTVHIADQILSAISEAHAHGVVHRDLKPENIMLTNVGEDTDFVKILDFGVAKRITTQTFATKDGLIFGSPRYISPEAASGDKVDQRSDLYSLGVILYQMLAGEPPFDSRKPVQLLMDHIKTPPAPLRQRPGAVDVTEAVEGIVMKMLSKRPEHRYRTAYAAREALIDATRGIVPAMSAIPARPEAPVAEAAPAQRQAGVPAPSTRAASPEQVAPGPIQARVPTAQASVDFAGHSVAPTPAQSAAPRGDHATYGEPVSESDLPHEQDVVSTEAMYSMQHRRRQMRRAVVVIVVLVLVPLLAVGGYFLWRALSPILFPYDRMAQTGEGEGEETEDPEAQAGGDDPQRDEGPVMKVKLSLSEVSPLALEEVTLQADLTGLPGETPEAKFVVTDVAGGEVRVPARQVQVQGDGLEGRLFTASHTFVGPGYFQVSLLVDGERVGSPLGVSVEEGVQDDERDGKKKKKKKGGSSTADLDFGPDLGPVSPPDPPPEKDPAGGGEGGGGIKIIKVGPVKEDPPPKKKSSWY